MRDRASVRENIQAKRKAQAAKKSEHTEYLQSGPGLALGMVAWHTFHDYSSEREGQEGPKEKSHRRHKEETKREINQDQGLWKKTDHYKEMAEFVISNP